MIYHEVHGSGPAILLVHGSGGHHAAWWQQVADLRRRFTVITVDLPGFGKSPASTLDVRDHPAEIVAVLDEIDLRDVLLVGQSIGAVAALRAGLARPDRVAGVVLAHSLGGISDAGLAELVAADRAEAVQLPVLDRLLSTEFQEREPAKTFLFQQMGTFNVATMADLRNLSGGGPTVDEVVASGLSVCFLAGERDAVLSPATVRAAHERVKGSTLELIPGAPHSMYWEASSLFNAAITRVRETV